MIKLKIDAMNNEAQIEELHISGTPTVLTAEIAALIGIVHQKIKGADKCEGEMFGDAMRHMMEADSPVWMAPDLPGETTVFRIPRK